MSSWLESLDMRPLEKVNRRDLAISTYYWAERRFRLRTSTGRLYDFPRLARSTARTKLSRWNPNYRWRRRIIARSDQSVPHGGGQKPSRRLNAKLPVGGDNVSGITGMTAPALLALTSLVAAPTVSRCHSLLRLFIRAKMTHGSKFAATHRPWLPAPAVLDHQSRLSCGRGHRLGSI